VIVSLLALPQLSDHVLASTTSSGEHHSVLTLDKQNSSSMTLHNSHDLEELVQNDIEGGNDHEAGCNMGVCFSFLLVSQESIFRKSTAERHLSALKLLIFSDGMFELHRPPNA
jgi:hypothetical protein